MTKTIYEKNIYKSNKFIDSTSHSKDIYKYNKRYISL